MLTPVQRVADFIVQEQTHLSHLKLQKLLYYAQGWHLGLTGKALFDEDFEAWVNGPVVPQIFQEYRGFGWRLISKPAIPVSLPPTEEAHIRRVLKVYGKYPSEELVRLSHESEPWIAARGNLAPNVSSNALITKVSMRAFFEKKARR